MGALAPIKGRSQLLQLASLAVVGVVVASTSATTTTSPRSTDCIERAERAEATVWELRDQVQALQGTVEGLTASIRRLTVRTDASLQSRLLEAPSVRQLRGRRAPNASLSGCHDYSTASNVCPTCGGAFDPCDSAPGSRCSSEINTTCTILRTFEPSGFEFGWPSLHTFTECAAAVVCIDCTTSTIDRVPCPPDGYTGVNTSRVLLLLDNTRNLNLSGAFGGDSAYPHFMAGLSLSNATIDGSLLDMSAMRIGGNVNLSQTTVINGLKNSNFYAAIVNGNIDLSGADVSGGLSGDIFFQVAVNGNIDLSGANVSRGISNSAFARATVFGNIDLSGADVSGGILQGAFARATVSGNIDLSRADVSGGILQGAFFGVIVNGIDLSGANVSGGILQEAFTGVIVTGSIDLSGADVSGGISPSAFEVATIGLDMILTRTDLSPGGLQPAAFLGATVFGVFNASGARFPNNTLPVQMLYGLNAQGGLDFSSCNLVSLSARSCTSDTGCRSGLKNASRYAHVDPSVLESLEGGPFTGMSMPVGIESIAVDLSQNQLTEINPSSLLGATATSVDLSGNPKLSVYHPFWFQSVANARVIDTSGNPTRCHRLNATGTPSAAFTFAETATTECICSSDTAGTGNFCTAQPCNATLKALNHYGAITLGGAHFTMQPGRSTLPSRESAKFECPPGKHPNNVTAVQAECLGGAFVLPTNQCVDDATQRFTSGEIAGIVLGALLATGIAGYCVYVRPLQRKRRHLSYALQDTVKQTELNERLLEATQGDLEEATAVNTRMRGAWKIAEDDVGIGVVLASGAFGVVHDGTFAGLRVAVKVLKKPLDEELYPDVGREFARECETLMSMRHASLLIFYGAGLTSENRPFMVTEFMSRGSLRAVLLDLKHGLGWDVRRKIAVQIARGMEYLHELGIVHRDLKVCDFGTSRLLTSHRPLVGETSFHGDVTAQGMAALTATMTKGVGTLLWMAPELFQGGSKYGPEVDVYSYGIILWELATRERPWDQIGEQQYIKFYAALSAALEADERPTISPSVTETQPDFVALMQRCWGTNPTTRPSFGEVVRELTVSRDGV